MTFVTKAITAADPGKPGFGRLFGELNALHKDIADCSFKLANAIEPLAQFVKDSGNILKKFNSFAESLQGMLNGGYPGEQPGLGTFIAMVPEKCRPYSMNIPRSAFISRQMTMTIDRGMLLGFSHTKPSEVESFPKIS